MTEETTRQEKLEKVYALGYEFEAKYGVCPQCTIAAVQEVFGVIDDETFKATQGLAGGGALTTQGTCGALIGAMIAMGALVGRDKESFRTTRSRDAMVHSKDVFDAFVAEFGSPICGKIQEKLMGRAYDMWDPDDFAAFEAAGGHSTECTHVVGTAARIAAKKVMEIQEAQGGE